MIISNPLSHATLKKILFLHFFICGLAFIKLSMLLVDDVYNVSLLNFAVSKIGYQALVNGSGKLAVILQYFFGLVCLAVYIGLVACVLQYGQLREKALLFKHKFLLKKIGLVLFFLLNGFFTYRLIVAGNFFLHWVPTWLFFVMLLPMLWLTIPLKTLPLIPRWFCRAAIVFLLAQVWFIFQPLIFKPMLIENDYMDIPGQTQLQTGEWVDTTQFVNDHDIGGLFKYDPRIDQGAEPELPPNSYVVVPATPLLDKFLAMNEYEQKYHLIYDRPTHQLSVKGEIPGKQYFMLSAVFDETSDQQKIAQLVLLSVQQRDAYQHRVYTPLEWNFIEKNLIEFIDQSRTAWFFYHHNYFFTPIFAAAQGADLSQITMVYGWYNTIAFSKILTWMGGVNYQNYFHLFFSFYPPYYLGFLLLVLFIFRRVEYGLLALLISVASLLGIGIELIRLWPGLNPVRHLFDLPALFCFYLYARDRRITQLLLSYGFSFIALACSKEFGLFLIASISTTVVLRAAYERSGLWPSFLAVFMSCIALGGFIVIPGKNPNFAYFLLGIGSPMTHASVVFTALLCSGLFYFAAVLFRDLKDPVNYFWLAVMFYSQLLMIYVLWFPMPHHLLNIAVPLSLLVCCFIYLLIRYTHAVMNERALLNLALMLVFIVYIPTAFSFYFHEKNYYRNFATHKVYVWPFPTAGFQSTMQPELFSSAVQLIDQYAPEKSIYIISRYEALLPILAGKYTAMPYNELLTNLQNTNDYQLLADYFQLKKPRYLFVDTDIDRNFYHDIFMPDDPLTKEFKLSLSSYDRAFTLRVLKNAFDAVRKDYRPIAKSELITVYERVT